MVRDLLFASKIDAAAKTAGVDLAWVPRGVALAEAARQRGADAVLIDLGEPEAVPAIRALLSERPGVRVIAFTGHLRTDLLEEARSAGVAEVWTRGQLNAGLVDILSRAGGTGAALG